MSEGVAPPDGMPAIRGDYNATGWSGRDGDDCVYILYKDALEALHPIEGMRVFVFDEDIDDEGNAEVFGFVCRLEIADASANSWRARPLPETWYRGPGNKTSGNTT